MNKKLAAPRKQDRPWTKRRHPCLDAKWLGALALVIAAIAKLAAVLVPIFK